jgi:hypothetical protein
VLNEPEYGAHSTFNIQHLTFNILASCSDHFGCRHSPALRLCGAKGLLIPRSQRRIPIAIVIADHFDLPRLATDGTILHVRLTASAAFVDIEVDVLPTIRAAERYQFSHFK